MKKSLSGVVALLAGAFVAHAQGTVGFGNYGTGYNNGTYITVSLKLTGMPTTLLGGTSTGPTATPANYASETANGLDWTVALYGAATGGTPAQLLDATSVPVTTTLAPGGTGDDQVGTWASGDAGIIPGTAEGGAGIVQVYAWYNEGGMITTYAAAQTAMVPTGFSAVAPVSGLGGPVSGAPPAIQAALPIAALGSFTVTTTTPEPSTITLGVMGASAFLLRLRKKK